MDGSGGSDRGLFGPGSVCWRVHSDPAMFVGGLRALLVQTFHPLAMAGVAMHSDYKHRAIDRLRRTSFYVATTTFGDTAAAYAVAERVKKIHKRVRGTDPVTGQPYSADDPETALWVHCGEVHSFLTAYKHFSGPISPDDEDRYYAETARLPPLLGVPESIVPKSRAEMRAYFERVRPRLCVSEMSRDGMNFVLHPPLVKDLLPYNVPIRALARAAVAIMPRYLRSMAGLETSRAADAMTIAALRPVLASFALPGIWRIPAMAIGKDTAAYGRRAVLEMRGK